MGFKILKYKYKYKYFKKCILNTIKYKYFVFDSKSDVVFGAASEDEAFELFLQSKEILQRGASNVFN